MKYIVFEKRGEGHIRVELPYTKENEEHAKNVAGEYEIINKEPSIAEKTEAQAAYTAMMTDTLLESEV